MGFSRPEYWSGQPIPSPADLPDPGIEPESPALQADSLPTELSGKLLEHKGDHLLPLPGERVPGILGGSGHGAAILCQAGNQ